MPDIDIGWRVKLDELTEQLRKGSDLSSAEVKRLGADLRSALKRNESEAEKSAKRIAAAEVAGAKAAAGAAAKAAAEVAKVREQARAEHERQVGQVAAGGKKILSMLGGPFAELGDLGELAGERLGGATKVLGTTGTVAAGAAIGVAALAVGTYAAVEALRGLADGGVASVERLREIRGAAALDDATIDSLDEYQQAQLGLEVQTASLSAEIGALASEVLVPGTHAIAAMVAAVRETVPRWEDWDDTIESVGVSIRGAMLLISLGGSELLRYGLGLDEVAESGRDAAAGLDDLTAAVGRHDRAVEERTRVAERMAEEREFETQALKDLGLVYDDTATLAEEARRKAEAERKAREALTHAIQSAAEASRKAADERREYLEINDRELEAERAYKGALEERAQAHAELVGHTAHLVDGLEELIAQAERLAEELEPTMVERWGAQFREELDSVRAAIADAGLAEFGQALDMGLQTAADAFSQRSDKLAEEVEARRDAAREEADAAEDTARAKIAADLEAGAISQEEADARIAAVEAERAAKEQSIAMLGAKEAEAARRAFENSKKVQKAMAVIEGLRAAVALIPAFAFLGPGAPLAASSLAAAATAVQLGAIDAQDPPELASGRVPGGSGDHRQTVRIRDDEGVLTGRGVDLVGGPDAVRAANLGRGGGGAGGLVVPVHLDGTLVGEAVLGTGGVARWRRSARVLGKRAMYGGGR